MIDEKKLIEWLKGKKYITVNENSTEMTEEFEKDHQWKLSRNCFINKVINFIDEQPKVSEWIPCSERLPEKAGKYLVTIIEGGSVHTSVRRFNPKPKHPEQNEPIFTKHFPYYSGWERATKGVVAWKPLPEPYIRKKVTE